MVTQITQAGGAIIFVVGMLGWYMVCVIMAAEMGYTTKLPVGDLSHFWAQKDVERG